VREAGLPVELRIEGERRKLPVGLDLSAYRIVQEALTNALKHARPSEVKVEVCRSGDLLRLEVRNDRGQANGKRRRGHGQGLIGMRERARAYGGDLHAVELPDGGFQVIAEIPCPV
jgi:signal transduction histidine kinase